VANALQPPVRVNCNVQLTERTNHPRALMLASLTPRAVSSVSTPPSGQCCWAGPPWLAWWRC